MDPQGLCIHGFYMWEHKHTYCSNYEDPYGNKNYKEFKRPSIAHFLFEFLPLIDEHNKVCMKILSIERNWHTKNFWFRLLKTMLGCSIVDLHRWDRNKRHVNDENPDADSSYEDMHLKKLCNLLFGWLKDHKFYPENVVAGRNPQLGVQDLKRIRGQDGTTNIRVTRKEASLGKATGRYRQQKCFMCRRYQANQRNTQWRCARC